MLGGGAVWPLPTRRETNSALQNILMRKLGLTGESQVAAKEFECYIQVFNNGLTEEQA
jgi:hypothetical protein